MVVLWYGPLQATTLTASSRPLLQDASPAVFQVDASFKRQTPVWVASGRAPFGK
jgi:hypothetical protein